MPKIDKKEPYLGKLPSKIPFIDENRACFYCKKPMTLRKNRPRTATWDHAIPKSTGGSDEISNLRLCCRRCNEEKDCLTEEQYQLVLEKRSLRTLL